VKNEGTYIRPVFIGGQNQDDLNYMSALSSEYEVSKGNSFGELPTLVQNLLPEILCYKEGPVVTAFPTYWPTSLPTSRPSPPNGPLSQKPSIQSSNIPSMASVVPSNHPSGRPSSCTGIANVCIALDMSGSICSPDFSNPQLCENCPNECNEDPFNQFTCCGNFNAVKSFTIELVKALAAKSFGGAQFSLVQFSTTATRISGVSSSSVVIPLLNGLTYTGGWKNHAEALERCQETFDAPRESYIPGVRDVIILVTDGVATWPEANPFGEAQSSAALVKNEGTYIRPVFIGGQNQGDLNYMSALSSDEEVSEGNSFEELPTLVQNLLPEILCDKDGPVGTSWPTYWPTSHPTSGP